MRGSGDMMNRSEKIKLLQNLNNSEMLNEDAYYKVLCQCSDLKTGYDDYMTTQPIDCDAELRRLPTADYDLCCALLTMLLREDHFCNGSFARRQETGQVKPIIERMIKLLETK